MAAGQCWMNAGVRTPEARTLLESMRMVAMYRGSCLFQPSRSSGAPPSPLSYMIVLCSLSLHRPFGRQEQGTRIRFTLVQR
jgi:hypothetical protein